MLDHIRGLYAALTEGELGVVGNWFAWDATYVRAGVPVATADGHERILEEYRYLQNCIKDLRVEGLDVRGAGCRQYLPGTARCFAAVYTLAGTVVEAVDGLDYINWVVGHKVRLLVQDNIWVNRDGQIVRIESSVVTGP